MIDLNLNTKKLKENDYVYIVNYDDMNFHITKKKIIKIDKRKRNDGIYYFLIYDTYVYTLEDNTTINDDDIDSFLFRSHGAYSSKENAIKKIQENIDYQITNYKYLIDQYKYKLKQLENQKKVYNKYNGKK